LIEADHGGQFGRGIFESALNIVASEAA